MEQKQMEMEMEMGQSFDEALNLDLVFSAAYYGIGSSYLRAGKPDEGYAEGFYRKAAEHRAADYRIIFNKSRAWYLRGDREKAIYYLESCLAMEALPPDFKRAAQQGLKELKELKAN